jgi:hypothetical protein
MMKTGFKKSHAFVVLSYGLNYEGGCGLRG